MLLLIFLKDPQSALHSKQRDYLHNVHTRMGGLLHSNRAAVLCCFCAVSRAPVKEEHIVQVPFQCTGGFSSKVAEEMTTEVRLVARAVSAQVALSQVRQMDSIEFVTTEFYPAPISPMGRWEQKQGRLRSSYTASVPTSSDAKKLIEG